MPSRLTGVDKGRFIVIRTVSLAIIVCSLATYIVLMGPDGAAAHMARAPFEAAARRRIHG